MKYKVTTGPTSEPISLTEVKEYLKVDSSADDALIGTLITAARQWVENHCSLALLPQTVLQVWDGLNDDMFLARSPLRSVSAITYLDTGGTVQTLSATVYDVDGIGLPPRLFRKYGQTWPATQDTPGSASAIFTAGYDASASVPAAIKTAMMLTIADMYDNRTDYVKRLPTAAEYILQAGGYRVWQFQ
jgi:uncharacterized phiE125 gp8 family phage protein